MRAAKGTPLLERLALHTKINQLTGCWEWMRSTNPGGYGQIMLTIDGKKVSRRTHKLTYELLVGPVPEGMELDHLCRNRLCRNPTHLEPVTKQENIKRGR